MMYDNTLACLCMECMIGSQLKWLFAVYTYWLGGLIRWDQSGDNYLYLIQQVEGVNEGDVKGFTTHNLIIKVTLTRKEKGHG